MLHTLKKFQLKMLRVVWEKSCSLLSVWNLLLPSLDILDACCLQKETVFGFIFHKKNDKVL